MTTRRLIDTLIITLMLWAAASNAQTEVVVVSADPATAEQGTLALDVTVSGSGFEPGADVKFLQAGSNKGGGVSVNSVLFVSPNELITNVDVAPDAVVGDYDIEVRVTRGRRGKGTTKFAVQQKLTGKTLFARADFQTQATVGSPGIYDDGELGFLCGGYLFDYVDDDDSSADCAPAPGAQSGLNNSPVASGGAWRLRLWEETPGDNPRTVTVDFSGNSDALECVRLNAELAEMGLQCGCDDSELSSACRVHVWINADNLFKSGATREVFSRFDLVEVGGLDGQDGPDLRIEFLEEPYICEVPGHEGDADWRVVQTAPCGSADLLGGALANLVVPGTGPGGDEFIGQWLLPLKITAQQVEAATGGSEPPPACTDADGDGVCVEDGDCDDSNPDIYPGHSDRGRNWGRDGVDNDCDGTPDR